MENSLQNRIVRAGSTAELLVHLSRVRSRISFQLRAIRGQLRGVDAAHRADGALLFCIRAPPAALSGSRDARNRDASRQVSNVAPAASLRRGAPDRTLASALSHAAAVPGPHMRAACALRAHPIGAKVRVSLRGEFRFVGRHSRTGPTLGERQLRNRCAARARDRPQDRARRLLARAQLRQSRPPATPPHSALLSPQDRAAPQRFACCATRRSRNRTEPTRYAADGLPPIGADRQTQRSRRMRPIARSSTVRHSRPS